jgi:hypothetical protein
MDERTGQIREGAGQVESKLNQEFIDWLRRWSTPILLVIAAVALGFVIFQRYEKYQESRVNSAFEELEAATSPAALEQIASDFKGVRAVPSLARLRAADIYLSASRTGLRPGATPGAAAPDDVLSDADRAGMLDQAAALYRRVLSDEESRQPRALHAINAAYGLAAVAEGKGDLEGAKGYYERVIKLADWAGYPEHQKIAARRIERLPELSQAPKLLSRADLPKPPSPAPPAAAAQPAPSSDEPFSMEPVTGEPQGEPLKAVPIPGSNPAEPPPAAPPQEPGPGEAPPQPK